jgi:hypothetical protein
MYSNPILTCIVGMANVPRSGARVLGTMNQRSVTDAMQGWNTPLELCDQGVDATREILESALGVAAQPRRLIPAGRWVLDAMFHLRCLQHAARIARPDVR